MHNKIRAFICTAAAAALMSVNAYAAGEFKKGDVNGDGRVNVTDITKTAAAILPFHSQR